MSNKLSPQQAITKLQAKGISLRSISQLIGAPANYCYRIVSGTTKAPNYIIVDRLRELAEQLCPESQRKRRGANK